MVKKRKSSGLMSTMLGTMTNTVVGAGLIGATQGAASGMPAGAAKNIVSQVPTLEGISLMSSTAKKMKF